MTLTDGYAPDTHPYPVQRETDVVLHDGSTLHVRPLRPGDRDEIHAFLTGLSRESIGFRFFGAADLEWVTKWCLDVDYRDRYGVVAETGTPRRIVGHAAYIRIDSDRAEVGVPDRRRLAGPRDRDDAVGAPGRRRPRRGISTFTAEVLPANHRMVEVFRESGFELEVRSAPTRFTSSSDLAVGRGAGTVRRTGSDRRGGRGAERARTAVGGRDRRVAPARNGRRPRCSPT